ncbi:MAG: RNA polymerase sigma factor [Leptospiraceae bacterium]|nr:RNA polymerase sigma factor [Leptospiraceae bacterium]
MEEKNLCNPTDWASVQEILKGKYSSFETLMDKYQGMVFAQCMKFSRNTEEAEDMTQEIFIKAFENLSQFRGESQFSTWLYKIAQNLLLTKSRKKQVHTETLVDGNFSAESKVEEHDSDFKMKLQNLLSKLPKNYKLPIMLYYYENMSYAEIAVKLNLKLGTLKSHILRGKELLKGWLQNEKRKL